MTVSKGMKLLSRKYVLKIEIFTNVSYCSPEKCWVRYTRYINQLLTRKPPKCWVCDTSTHWVDQWERFKSMGPEERLKSVRKNMPASVVLRMLIVTTEHQIVANESSAPKKPTVTVQVSSLRFLASSKSSSVCECRISVKLYKSNATSSGRSPARALYC